MEVKKVVVLDSQIHTELTIEMAKQGRTRKAIVRDAIKMYLKFKKSERLMREFKR